MSNEYLIPSGEGGSSDKISATIPAGQTADIDTNACDSFTVADYFVAAKSASNFKTFHMNVLNTNADPLDSIFARLGNLGLEVSSIKVATDILLRVRNTGTTSIQVEVTKFLT